MTDTNATYTMHDAGHVTPVRQPETNALATPLLKSPGSQQLQTTTMRDDASRCRPSVNAPAIINLTLFALMVTANILAANAITPVFPISVGAVSRQYPTRFTPAGYAFAIWSVIYGLLLLFTTRFLYTAKRRTDLEIIFPITCILNITWLIMWSNRFIAVSMGFMAALWLSLLLAWIRLNVVRPPVPTPLNFVTILTPFSLYFGWVSMALFANLAVAVNTLSKYSFGATAAISAVTVGCVLGMLALSISMDIVYVASVAWALVAIGYSASQHDDPTILAACGLGVASLVGASVVRFSSFLLRDCRREPREYLNQSQLSAVQCASSNFLSVEGL